MAAGALAALPAVSQDAIPEASAIKVDPDNPFGSIDTNLWYLAEFLSGRQADGERWRWVESLSEGEKAEMQARCEQISADPDRYGDDATLICISVRQVLNQ